MVSKTKYFINFRPMKYKIIKIAALLAILVQLSSCYTEVKTDNRTPSHRHYQRAGRYW